MAIEPEVRAAKRGGKAGIRTAKLYGLPGDISDYSMLSDSYQSDKSLPVSILTEDSSFERVGKRLPVEAHGGRGREVFRFEIVRTGSSVRESE